VDQQEKNDNTIKKKVSAETVALKRSDKNKKRDARDGQESNKKDSIPRSSDESSTLFLTATPVQSTAAALNVADGKSLAYVPLHELSQVKQVGASYGTQKHRKSSLYSYKD